jgi:tetratricopeptide (TPR) repeat protein
MKSGTQILVLVIALVWFNGYAFAQLSEICGDVGGTAWLSSPIVYGKVGLNGFDLAKRLPKITVTLIDRQRNENRLTIDRTGKYCFRDIDGSGGLIIIDVEGVEMARETLPTTAFIKQHRQDFDLYANGNNSLLKPPSAISAKYNYPRSEANAVLFEKASAEEKIKQYGKAIDYLKEIVRTDPNDFVAWARLGSIYFEQKNFAESEIVYKKALSAKPDHTPSILNLGRIYLMNSKLDDAIALLQQATKNEPTNPRGFQLLGEALLLAKKGTLGVEALYEAIRLDPVGMAECHLLIARLFDRAGAKGYASREYRLFLEKVPEHPDKKKFQQYIKDNPEPAEDK